ncbi:MAG: hypothetical protein P8J27_15315, partial [Mariniblastus sp.]|nr:hypothetical protein [Mariniblastus sp.]
MDEMLQKRLEPVLRRVRIRRVALALGLIWSVAALAAAWCFFLNQSKGFDTSQVIWLILGGTVVASLVAIFHAIYNAKRISQVVD